MRHFLFFCLWAVMTFLLTACSMQSPEADLSAVDANTESVSNNVIQSGVSGKSDVPSAETPPEKPEPSTETDAPVIEEAPVEEAPVEEPAQVPTLMLSIDGTPVTVLWEDNETVSELLTVVQNGAIEVSVSRYGGFEQVGSLPQSFSRSDVQMTTQPGDIVLYSGNQLVIFFGSNSWSYTRLGHIEGLSTDELTALLDKDTAVIEIKKRLK